MFLRYELKAQAGWAGSAEALGSSQWKSPYTRVWTVAGSCHLGVLGSPVTRAAMVGTAWSLSPGLQGR